MSKAQAAVSLENMLSNWNTVIPHYTLKADDLKKPHALMNALFHIFDRLGINKDYVLAPPEDCNESLPYYWDLVPVINMTRVVNHLLAEIPQDSKSHDHTISIIHILQPTTTTSHSIILLLFNIMWFKESQLNDIAPKEEALFAKTEQVKTLEDRKNYLLGMLNKQAEEMAKRAERMEKLGSDVKQFEEDLKQEKDVHNEEKMEQEPLLKENEQNKLTLEQRRSQRDVLLPEVARKKALRVYDADDIKAQVEQATQNVQEAEEKLNTLRNTLMHKENSLKNLQTIKPSLDTANNLLHEIMKITESIKDFEAGDLDTDSKEGELDVLNTELSELQVQLSELQAARAEAAGRRQDSEAKRQSEKSQLESALREAEEKDRKCRERNRKAVQRIDEIKQLTIKYEQQKSDGIEALAEIKNNFCGDIKSMEEMMIKKLLEVEMRVDESLKRRNL